MASQAPKLFSYHDIEALPDHLVGELVGGELFASPRPARRHTRTASALMGSLFGPLDGGHSGPGGWWILSEPELHLGNDVLVPDLAGWRRERLPALEDDTKAYFDIAPDWVCEVPSKSTARLDRTLKMPIYAQQGVEHVWIIDPVLTTLEVFARTSDKWTLLAAHVGDVRVRAAPFDGVETDLGVLWL